ncbi:MAG: shikimate dehydrogenase [Acutalibacteraceae bacterium]|nr:shikimate dehydrogenase [Acutalibacteraceae bacterium]
MSKKKYAVIGHPIGHTMSPFIHNRLFDLAGIDAEYSIIDVAPEMLAEDYKNKLSKLDGFNITIPHKSAIIPCLTGLDKKAELYGSVNTVDANGRGYTTDPDGFLQALKAQGIALEGSIVIVGTGGVSRTMAFEAAKAGADLTIAVRREDIHVVAELACEIMTKTVHPSISTCYIDRLDKFERHIELLVNATPLGMYPNIDNMAVSENIIERSSAVFDAVYNPLETKLIKTAKAMGKKAIGGMDMLVWQAVVSHQIWDGSTYALEDIEQLCLDASAELEKNFK